MNLSKPFIDLNWSKGVDAKGQPAGFPQARVVTLTETGTHARIDAAVLVEVGIEYPRPERLTELEWNSSSSSADGRAREPFRMRRYGEQRGGGADVGGDDVRALQTDLDNESGQKPAHGAGREKIVAPLGRAEPG